MSLYMTANFNVSLFRLDENGCQRNLINSIALTFKNTNRIKNDSFTDSKGDFEPTPIIINTFIDNIIEPFNYKTLVQSGVNKANAYTKVVYLDYPTSIENIAIDLYKKLKLLYAKKNIELASVKVKESFFTAEYPEK